MSEFELRGFTLALVAQVEETFWDYALARRQVEIYEESLKVARQQVDETLALIEVGRLGQIGTPRGSGGNGGPGAGTHQCAKQSGNPAAAALAPPQSGRGRIRGSGKWIWSISPPFP